MYMIHLPLAYVIFPYLGRIKKKLHTDEAQYLYVFVIKSQVASCFRVSEDLHTLLYHWKCLKEPNWPQPLQKYSKIKLHGPFLIWCPMTCDLLNLTRHHFHTLPYRQTPTQFFLGKEQHLSQLPSLSQNTLRWAENTGE